MDEISSFACVFVCVTKRKQKPKWQTIGLLFGVNVIYCMDLTWCFFCCLSVYAPRLNPWYFFLSLKHPYFYGCKVFPFSFHMSFAAVQCTLISINTDWLKEQWRKKRNRNVHKAKEKEIPVLCLCASCRYSSGFCNHLQIFHLVTLWDAALLGYLVEIIGDPLACVSLFRNEQWAYICVSVVPLHYYKLSKFLSKYLACTCYTEWCNEK